jgi:FkbM family methyltransferase
MVGPRGTLVCFEPLRHLSQILAANLALNELTNAYVKNIALSKESGFVPVPLFDYGEKGNYGAYSLLQQQEWSRVRHENVQLGVMDDYLSFVNNVCPRLIKVDVEGMELDVLKGATNLFQECSPVLHLENNCIKDSPLVLEYLANDLGYDKIYWDIHVIYQPNNFFGLKEDVISSGSIPAMSINIVALRSATTVGGVDILHWIESKGMVQMDLSKGPYSSDYTIPVGEDLMIITQLGDNESCTR